MKILKLYWFIGIICSICLISCSKDEDIFIGHGSIVYDGTTYQLDYADVKKQLGTYVTVIDGENIYTYFYSFNLYYKNLKNKVNIQILSHNDVTFSELSGEYQVTGISLNTFNRTIQAYISLTDYNYDDYFYGNGANVSLYKDLQNNNVYSLKLKSINDDSDFITWEGPFNFQAR
ncbi:MAG: hypothetical protein LBK94_11945 [Prevotellaceae bacterium]|jgi:hypothetical protein|nr:hypothetical protein [Prevotellaceae bacterium]